MNIDYNAIGKRIQIKRKKLHYTQQQLAEKSGLSNTNISHIERGATKLSLPSLISIANALETTADALLMDVLQHSDIQFQEEFSRLLKGCSRKEYMLLINICKSALHTLRHASLLK